MCSWILYRQVIGDVNPKSTFTECFWSYCAWFIGYSKLQCIFFLFNTSLLRSGLSLISYWLTLNVFFPCRSLTKSTTPPGIASWEGTSGVMWLTRPNTSSTFTWVRWPSCSSSRAERRQHDSTDRFELTVLTRRTIPVLGPAFSRLLLCSFHSDYCLENGHSGGKCHKETTVFIFVFYTAFYVTCVFFN